MRATTPACPLGPINPVPQPKFKIGQTVLFNYNHPSDKGYYLKLYLRHLLRYHRRIHQRLLKGGYTEGVKLPNPIKGAIKDCLSVLREATEGVIIGIVPHSMFNIDSTYFNECYVGGVSGASSPLDYGYHIMIRTVKGVNVNTVAMITGIPIGGNNSFIVKE